MGAPGFPFQGEPYMDRLIRWGVELSPEAQGGVGGLSVSLLPLKPMMDRNKAAELPKLQVSFIDFVCTFVYKVSRAAQGLAGFTGEG